MAKLDYEEFNKLLTEGMSYFLKSKNKSVIPVVGRTGAGKSMFVNRMLGCKYERKILEDDIQLVAVDAKKEITEIGHGFSKTLYPFVTDTYPNFIDCPGYGDLRELQEKLITRTGLNIIVKNALIIQGLIIIIDFWSLVTDRSGGLYGLLDDINNSITLYDNEYKSFLIVITKAEPTYQKIPVTDKLIISKFNKCISDIKTEIEKNQNVDSTTYITRIQLLKHMINAQIFLFDIGEDKHIKQINTLIQKLVPIDKKYFRYPILKSCPYIDNIISSTSSIGNELLQIRYDAKRRDTILSDMLYNVNSIKIEYDEHIDSNTSSLDVKIDDFERQIINYENEIKLCQEKIAELNTDKEKLIYEDKFHEIRSDFGFLARSRKTYCYNGSIPLLRVDKYPEKKFKHMDEKLAKSFFYAEYISDRYENGDTWIKCYIRQKDHPSIIAEINANRSKISELENNIRTTTDYRRDYMRLRDDMKSRIDKKVADKSAYEETIRTKQRFIDEHKTKLTSEKQAISNTLADVEAKITTHFKSFELLNNLLKLYDEKELEPVLKRFIMLYNQPITSEIEYKNEYTCIISGQIMLNPQVLPCCGQTIDLPSILNIVGGRRTFICPLCKREVDRTKLIENLTMRSNIMTWIDSIK